MWTTKGYHKQHPDEQVQTKIIGEQGDQPLRSHILNLNAIIAELLIQIWDIVLYKHSHLIIHEFESRHLVSIQVSQLQLLQQSIEYPEDRFLHIWGGLWQILYERPNYEVKALHVSDIWSNHCNGSEDSVKSVVVQRALCKGLVLRKGAFNIFLYLKVIATLLLGQVLIVGTLLLHVSLYSESLQQK